MDSATARRMISLAATLCLILINSTPANSASSSTTAYELLQDNYNLPSGLLPRGVKGYDLKPETGEFSAYFNDSCSFHLEGQYRLSYNSTVRGFISSGKITSLEGVSVQVFALSKDIVEVLRSGNNLVFFTRGKSAGFPIDNFEESPQCGCGFNCRDGQIRKLRRNPFLSGS